MFSKLLNYLSKNIYYSKLLVNSDNVFVKIISLLKSSLIDDKIVDLKKFQSELKLMLIEDQSLNKSSIHSIPFSPKSKIYYDKLNNFLKEQMSSMESYHAFIYNVLVENENIKEIPQLKKLNEVELFKLYNITVDDLTHFILKFITNVYRDLIKKSKKNDDAGDLMVLRQSFIISFKTHVINNIYLELIKIKEYETLFSEKELRFILNRSSPNSRELKLINFFLEGLFKSEIISEFKYFEKGKSKIFYKLNNDLYELFKHPTSYNIIIPSLTIPSDWYFDTVLKEWRQNSLYTNNEKNTLTLSLQSNSFRGDKLVVPNDYIISIINKQQKVPFNISLDILKVIIDCTYFYSFKFDFKEFINEYLSQHNLPFYKSYVEVAKRLFLRRTSMLLKVNILIYVSVILSNAKQFFFDLFLDFRGRLYSNGYPIGPISDFLGRWMLLIKNKSSNYDQILSDEDLSSLYFKDLKPDKDELFDDLHCHESFFYERNIVLDLKKNMIMCKIAHGLDNEFIFPVSIDMKCAGLGHLGLLTGNFDLLYRTHILAHKLDPSKDNDLYSYFQNCVRGFFVKSETKNKTKKESNIIYILDSMDRALYKKIIMKLNYNESSYSRCQFIINELTPIIIGQPDSKIDSSDFYSLCYEIAKGYATVYQILFPLEHELLNIFGEVACLKGTYSKSKFFVWQTLPQTHSFHQFYFKDENFRKIYVYDPHTKSRTSRSKMMDSFSDFTKNIFEFLVNKRKTRNATKPNVSHNMECSILFQLLYTLQHLGLYVFTVHDCLYVNPKQILKIRQCYFDVCLEFLNSNFAIDNFIKLNLDVLINSQFNKIDFSNKTLNAKKHSDYAKCLAIKNRLNELLALIAYNKKNINDKISKGEYVMHTNILN